jgi:hypothetical protein
MITSDENHGHRELATGIPLPPGGRVLLQRILLALGLAATLGLEGTASAQLVWRVSAKFILDAAGNRPTSGSLTTDAQVQAYIDYGNDVLRKTGRGYQMQLVSVEDVWGASAWFDINATGDGDDIDETSDVVELEETVKDSFQYGANTFLFREDAINIYIVGSRTQGSCQCGSPADSDIIVLSQNISPDWVVLHESGHFLDLPHTHDGERFENSDGSACDEKCACANVRPGDDNLDDTLPDVTCWTQDQLGLNAFGTRYSAATPEEQTQIDNTFFNIMAKHGSTPGFRTTLTSDQLDAMTDASNGHRKEVASGRTVFVDATAGSLLPTGPIKAGMSGAPYRNLGSGINAADAGDIVLLRPGTYTDAIRLAKAVTLRATRGNATLRSE